VGLQNSQSKFDSYLELEKNLDIENIFRILKYKKRKFIDILES